MALEQRSIRNTKYDDIETLYKSNLVFKLFDSKLYSIFCNMPIGRWISEHVWYMNID